MPAACRACTTSASAGADPPGRLIRPDPAPRLDRGKRDKNGPGASFRDFRGTRRPGPVRCVRREPRGRGGIPRPHHGPVARRRVLPGPGAWGARARPGVRVRPPRRGRGHAHRAGPDGQGPDRGHRPGRASPAAPGAGRPAHPAPAARSAAAGGHPRPPVADRTAALQRPRRERDLAPLRRVQPLLRVGAGPVNGLHLRLLPDSGVLSGRGPGVQVRPGRTQARAAQRDAAARRRLRLGRHGHARGPGIRRPRARGHAVRTAGGLGPGGHRESRTVRPGRGPPPRLPGCRRDRLRRGQLDRAHRAHRHAAASGLLRVPARQAPAGGPPAESLHHPPGQHRARRP